MADIALVHLALDSSAVVAGEKQATRALQSVDSAMQRTEKQGQQLNTSLNANLKRSGDSFKTLGDSATRAGAALQGLGGPVGRLGGEISNLGGQFQTLTGSLGLVGGAAAAAVVGVAALGSALIKLTLDGVGVSDQLGDIAEATNLSADTVVRLAAAMRLSGEDISGVEKIFKTFTNAVADAKDKTSPAAAALQRFGTDAKTAGRDIEQSFIRAVLQLKEVRQTVDGVAASNLLFGQGVGALVRTVDNLNVVFGQSRKALEDSFIIPTQAGVEAGARLDAQLNTLNNTWVVFTQNLAATSVGAAIEQSLAGGIGALGSILGLLQDIEKNPMARLILTGAISSATGGLFGGAGKAGASARSVFDEWRGGQQTATTPAAPRTPTVTAKAAAAKIVKPLTEFTLEEVDPIKLGLAALAVQARAAEAAIESLALKEAFLTEERLEALEKLGGRGVPLALPGGLIQQGGPGQPFPGAPIFGGLPPPGAIRTEEQARLDEQFSLIFDDMLISILTAQKTLGGAFAGLAIGIVDTFAVEFTRVLRESFITPVIRGLTDMLQKSLQDLFGGLSAGGLKGVFGGIAKGIGTIFGGFFASGGTLGPGKFGVAGERGPELIFAGNQPMHIAPVTAGSAGNVFNISVGVNAPSGTVDKRTQDQLAATVMNAVKRAQRNEGAR